jgi:hypothetical protein
MYEDPHCNGSNARRGLPRSTRIKKRGCSGKGRCRIVSLRGYKREFVSAISIESRCAKIQRANEFGNFNSPKRPDGNAAAVEIRKQRGFPQLLGKVSPENGETFPRFHRPYWELFLSTTGKNGFKSKARTPPYHRQDKLM